MSVQTKVKDVKLSREKNSSSRLNRRRQLLTPVNLSYAIKQEMQNSSKLDSDPLAFSISYLYTDYQLLQRVNIFLKQEALEDKVRETLIYSNSDDIAIIESQLFRRISDEYNVKKGGSNNEVSMRQRRSFSWPYCSILELHPYAPISVDSKWVLLSIRPTIL